MDKIETLFGFPVKEVRVIPKLGKPLTHGWCKFCGFETEVALYKAVPKTESDQEDVYIRLCKICAYSVLGNCLMAAGKDKHLFKALAYATNTILREIQDVDHKPKKG